MLNQVIPVVIDLDIALAAAGGLLFQNRYYDVEGSILLHDGVRTLEDSRILLRQIPECRIEERLPVVGDDDCIEVRRGVIIRSHFLVPVERIHQVQVDKGPILRKFGLASVTVTTAGGIANLEYLDEPIAEDIAQNLNEKIIKMLKARE